MASKTTAKRDHLFEVGRSAVNDVLRPHLNGYICPICLDLFESPEELTLEHVPPRILRGKAICLTCKLCNSKAGHDIEGHFEKKRQFDTLLQEGERPRRFSFNHAGGALNVYVARRQGSVEMVAPRGNNSPTAVNATMDKLGSYFGEGTEFTLSTRAKFSKRAADVVYLKSAYLAAFAHFGYRWIFSEYLEPVRQRIRNPQGEHAERFLLYIRENDFPFKRALMLMTEPYRCLAAKIDSTITLLPWLKGVGSNAFEWLAEQERQKAPLNFKFHQAGEFPSTMEMYLDKIPADDDR